MFNKTIAIAFATIALITAAHADTTVRVNRMLKYASTEPLLYRVTELLPEYAKKEGINDVKVEFVDILESTKANEAMLLGQIDIIWGGINGFGILYDKKPEDTKILAGGEEFDNWLVCGNPKIKTLHDIGPTTKIAMKGLNSGEQMLLREFTAAEFGDEQFDKFASNIVVMPRDQALAQIISDKPEIECGVIGTPWQNIAVQKGAHIVAQSIPNKTYGTLNLVYSTKHWLDANPKLARAWIAAQHQAVQEFEHDPIPMLKTYIERDQVTEPTIEELIKQKRENKDVYEVSPQKDLAFIDFMYRVGILTGAGKGHKDMVWDEKLVK